MIRECLAQWLSSALGASLDTFASASDWIKAKGRLQSSAVVFSASGSTRNPDTIKDEITRVSKEAGAMPVILLSDIGDAKHIVDALRRGVRGYLVSNSTLSDAREAIQSVIAGGVFIPADAPVEPGLAKGKTAAADIPSTKFTSREKAVLEVLRKGKSNKTIAFDLNMRESTVKVHVRSIMRKMGAKNRTEVVYLARDPSKD